MTAFVKLLSSLFVFFTMAAAAAARAVKIVGISGSLRKHSANTNLLKSIQEASKTDSLTGIDFSIADISKLPMYNTDLESTGADGQTVFPAEVAALRQQLAAADAFIFATPEYNYSLTAALKNAIDWGSRSPNVFNDKAGGIVGECSREMFLDT